MTEPFFFIQYLAAVIYIIEKMPELSILLIGASIITTSINYIILYISYRKIKALAEVIVSVSVLRNGNFLQLPSSELVPGDIFIPEEELFCDVILLKGELYVN
jgi:magnesium-transporting ATPase (P-type)